ncbi:MAG: hypothetical protein ACTS68_00295 [Candidatus Hodgkinia cicadicola]
MNVSAQSRTTEFERCYEVKANFVHKSKWGIGKLNKLNWRKQFMRSLNEMKFSLMWKTDGM